MPGKIAVALMKRRDFLRQSAAAGLSVGSFSNADTASAAIPAAHCSPPPFPKSMGLTKHIAEFVVNTKYSDIPANVIELGKKSILDGLGLALCGSAAKTWNLFLSYIGPIGREDGGASVIGTSSKLSPRFAAFANGIAIHVNDYDDTQLATAKDRVYGLLVHPTVCALPAALSQIEGRTVSGRNLMLAYHLGVEVECKIAEAISPRHYEDGFHTTGTCGVFASAAVCANLRGFDVEQTVRTYGIAGSMGCGVRENFGTMMKPFHAGHSAESGVVAADLADLGWTATDQVLEAPNGFFHAYGGGYDPAAILNKLGRPWTFSSPGISIKPFPSGSLTHPGMTELLRLIHKEHITAAQIQSVDVGTNRNMPNTLIHHRPTNGLQAKFSMEFCLAILLIGGKAGLKEFTDAVVNRADVQEMIRRIHFAADPEAEKSGYDKMTTLIRVRLKDGRTISGRADFAKGSPADPMSYSEVADKFRDCAAFAEWSREKSELIVDSVRKLEDIDDVRTLSALCSK
jgi:2-methylcitrate dehydratase PrpD